MKIIIEKVTNEPKHSLTKAELKMILNEIPNEWNTGYKVLVLANAIYPRSDLTYYNNRPVDLYNGKLIISSRGYTKSDIIKEILVELCQQNSGDLNLKEGRRNSMSKNQRHMLDEKVTPIFNSIMELI